MTLSLKQYFQLTFLAIASSFLFRYSFIYIHTFFYPLIGPLTYSLIGPFFGVVFVIYILINHNPVKKLNLFLFVLCSVGSFFLTIPLSYFVSGIVSGFTLLNSDVFDFYFMGKHSYEIIGNLSGGTILFILNMLLVRIFMVKIKVLKPILFSVMTFLIFLSAAIWYQMWQGSYSFPMPLGFVGYYVIDVVMMILLGRLVAKGFNQTQTLNLSNSSQPLANL